MADAVQNIACSNEARAYIVGILSRPEVTAGSIILEYARARNGGFPALQRLGDSVTWSAMIVPECLGDHEKVAVSVARVSYSTCHRLLRGRWALYEELADDLPRLIIDVRSVISTWE